MICGCCKDLGCYSHNDIISFGLVSITDNSPYVFHIWSNGSYNRSEVTFPTNSSINLPFTFNENGETTIKIELPNDVQNSSQGIVYATTADGACCFTVHGLIKQCN